MCLVELKARFDERRNIEWSRELEQAGVHVVHGFPDMKIHAKMTLVVRREAGGLRRYVHIGTGNYHAATARLYEDVGIFTADEEIAADVADVFNYVTGFGRPQRFRKLLVAPFEMRARLIEEIRNVAAAAKAGETARIRLKLNNLVDPKIIDELYAASTAGATVEICARSICMIRPGVEGLSENISVRSILGRFLEHSRIYSFEAGDSTAIFIGSADMMPRNLDRRVEVLVPVESARSRQELQAVLGSVFADDVHAWLLASDGSWSRVEPEKARQAGRPPGRDDEAGAAARAPPDRRRHAGQGALDTTRALVCLSGSPVKMSSMRVAIIDVGSNTARLLVANVTGKGAVVPDCRGARLPAPRRRDRANGDAEREEDRRCRRHLQRLRPPDRRARRRAGDGDRDRSRTPGRRCTGADGCARRCDVAAGSGADGRERGPARLRRRRRPGASETCPRSSPSSMSAVARRRSSSARRCSAPPGSGRPTSARSGSRAPTSPTIRPRPPQIRAASDAVGRALAGMSPPRPALALAVGGSARALTKIVGRRFDADDLERAVKILSRRPAAKAARPFGIAPERAETLLAGALLLAGASRVLGTAFKLGNGGLREGAALELAGARDAVRAA